MVCLSDQKSFVYSLIYEVSSHDKLFFTSFSQAVHFEFRERARKSTSFDLREKNWALSSNGVTSDDEIILEMIRDLDWKNIFEVYHLEVSVFHESAIGVFASVVCRLSDTLQEQIGLNL